MFNSILVGSPSRRSGFTIVELLIVVVIVAVLATITVVSYNGITKQARNTGAKSDLISYAKKLEIDQLMNGPISSTLLSNYLLVDTTNTTIKYKYGDTSSSCIEGVSKIDGTIQYYIETSAGVSSTQPGTCPGSPITNATSRCVAGDVVLTANVTNTSSEVITPTTDTAYGTTVGAAVNPGATAAYAFSVRLPSMPRGVVTISLNGATTAIKRFHAYEPRNC